MLPPRPEHDSNKVRFDPPRHTRSVRERLLPAVQGKGAGPTTDLRNENAPVVQAIYPADQRPAGTLDPGHYRTPGRKLYLVHLTFRLNGKRASFTLRPPLFAVFTTRSARSRSGKPDNLNLLRASTAVRHQLSKSKL